MLLRRDGESVIAIPQPSHAWLSGQLACAWGNERFAAPTSYDEVCLAAEQHDIGWLDWEMAPALDAGIGLPQEFCKVPSKVHIALWREGVRRARVFGRYPALLVSLLIVSHDRDFLDRVATSVLVAEGGGRWVEYAGGYSDMVAQRGAKVGAVPVLAAPAKPKVAAVQAQRAKPRLSARERQVLDNLPARIEKFARAQSKAPVYAQRSRVLRA